MPLGKIGIEPSMDAEDELVDDDGGLIWGAVERAGTVGEARKNTRF